MRNLKERHNLDGFEIVVIARAKHAILYDLAQQFGGICHLAKHLGLSPATVGNWIALRTMPNLNATGKGALKLGHRRKIVIELSRLTGKRIEDIFPDYMREKLPDIPRKIEERQHIARNIVRDQRQRLTLPSPAALAEKKEEQQTHAKVIQKSLKTLSYREREVIAMRFGLNGYTALTLEEVGHVFRHTQERIRQIEAKALRKLRHPQRCGGLMEESDA